MRGDVYPFERGVLLLRRFLDAILVPFVGLIVRCVILGLGHPVRSLASRWHA